MNPKKVTKIFIPVMTVIIIGFDIWAFWQGGTESTISWVVYEWSYKYPILVLAVGILIGHLFWRVAGFERFKKRLKQKEGKDG